MEPLTQRQQCGIVGHLVSEPATAKADGEARLSGRQLLQRNPGPEGERDDQDEKEAEEELAEGEEGVGASGREG